MGITQVRSITYGMKALIKYWNPVSTMAIKQIPFDQSRSRNQYDISLTAPAQQIFQISTLPVRNLELEEEWREV